MRTNIKEDIYNRHKNASLKGTALREVYKNKFYFFVGKCQVLVDDGKTGELCKNSSIFLY